MNERKVWFITRPERDPKFHREALLALRVATNDFTVKWSGNREAHIAFERELGRAGVKRENISDSGSGGRTWAALLKTFSYCYTDEDGYLIPTKAGLSIIEKRKVFDNIKKQILTLQIPNAYFLESGFRPRYEEGFAIRPARFLIKLAQRAELNYFITKEEITFFVLTAKKDSQLEETIRQIVEFRQASPEVKVSIKQAIAAEYDHRERSDNAARDYEKAHSDVAHTFMLICHYTGMVEYLRGQDLRSLPEIREGVREELDLFDARYPFNKRYQISIERMAENNGLDVDSYKSNRMKNVHVASNRNKTAQKIESLLRDYPDISGMTTEQLIDIFKAEMPPREAEKLAVEVKEGVTEYQGLNTQFVEAYLNETDNLAFEDKTGEILKAIGFDVEMRPKPNVPVETEIEILVKYGDKCCGIIDAKNYKKKFALSASLASHMASEYIPNYEGYEGREVHFFGYVTATDFGGEKNLDKISQLVKRDIPDRDIKGFMLSARGLLEFLDHCEEIGLSQEEKVKLFLQAAVLNKGYKSLSAFIRAHTTRVSSNT